MKPLLLIVSGAPGSGKTTFASKLAAQMKLFHIERDRAFDAMRYTFEPHPFNREKEGIPLFYNFVAHTLKGQLSLVVDATLYRGKSEKDILQLHQYSTVINIHCRATNERQRFYERELAKAEEVPAWLPAHMATLDEIYNLVSEPLDIECPIIEVDTTDIYSPDIATIVSQIEEIRNG